MFEVKKMEIFHQVSIVFFDDFTPEERQILPLGAPLGPGFVIVYTLGSPPATPPPLTPRTEYAE